MTKVHCEECSEDAPSYEITYYGSMDGIYRQLCSCCFSAEVAKVIASNGSWGDDVLDRF